MCHDDPWKLVKIKMYAHKPMNLEVNAEIGPNNFEERLPHRIAKLLNRPGDGPALLVSALPEEFSSKSVSPKAGDPKTIE